MDVEEKMMRKEVARIKRLQKNGKRIFWIGWILWMLETTLYLISFGMHTKPATAGEKLCDDISGIIMALGATCLGLSMYALHKMIIKEIEKEWKDE